MSRELGGGGGRIVFVFRINGWMVVICFVADGMVFIACFQCSQGVLSFYV